MRRASPRLRLPMVEGHGVHRVAVTHRRALVGKRFAATSPNGRFEHGARAIDGEPLRKIEAIGKNLFYFYGDANAKAEEKKIVHVHFGMSGRFGVFDANTSPENTETTRLRLEGHGLVALLSAMTVDLVDEACFQKKKQQLGQDPLREDACPDTLWSKFCASRKSVGLALMDQAMFAGVGNIYRAEILYKAGVHPDEKCEDVDRTTFDSLWRHTVESMQRGFVNGSILTVDPEEALILGDPWTRRYVYNQTSCGRCGARVRVWDMANRTVYACETCQPLRRSASGENTLTKKKDSKPFVSHCAPDSAAASRMEPSRLTVAQLRETLTERGWPEGLKKTAKKSELVAAAAATFRAAPKARVNNRRPVASAPAPATPPPAPLSPGTKALESRMNSAREAAREKIAAGEKGNVEHVALADDETIAQSAKLLVDSKRKRSEERHSPAKRELVSATPATPDTKEKNPTTKTRTRGRVQ